MILILASQFDKEASQLAARWGSQQACVLTAYDLSRPGWLYRPDLNHWQGIVGDRVFGETDVLGILNCLSEITDSELGHIAFNDRGYVAAEMNAFLVAWESHLACPVINQPVPHCLVGPVRNMEEWVLIASRLEIPAVPVKSNGGGKITRVSRSPRNPRSVTLVGDFVLSKDKDLACRAQSLARAAGVTFASFYFNDSDKAELCGVSLRPDLKDDATADALLHCFGVLPAC